MVLSKLLKYSAVGVGLLIFGEMYYKCVREMKNKLRMFEETKEVTECFHTRKTKEQFHNSKIIRQIDFCREPALFITEILEKLILSARKTVHVAMYIFTSTILADALKSVHQKGVKIYVIVDHSMEAASGTQTQNLKEKGITVKICYSSTLHHKFCLIDVPYNNNVFATEGNSLNSETITSDEPCQVNIPKHGILINGSLNWTREALTNNYENFIVTSNKNVISQYYDEFVERWKSSNDL